MLPLLPGSGLRIKLIKTHSLVGRGSGGVEERALSQPVDSVKGKQEVSLAAAKDW